MDALLFIGPFIIIYYYFLFIIYFSRRKDSLGWKGIRVRLPGQVVPACGCVVRMKRVHIED